MEISRRVLRVPRERIWYLSWTLDSYEGIGFLRTDDAAQGIVSVLCPPEQAAELDRLLEALSGEGFPLERLEEGVPEGT